MRQLIFGVLAALWLIFAGVMPAQALVFDATVSPTKSNGDFIAGTGIPADGFTVDNGTDGEQIGLKGEGAFNLDGVLGMSGNRYFMKPGLNTSGSAAPGQGTWAFNFHYSPGTGNPTTDTLRLEVDFDPGFSSTNFVTIELPIFDGDSDPTNSWDDGDGFFTNPGGGAWTSDDVPFVYSQSWGMHFNFWTLLGASPLYDPFTVGEYEIRFTSLAGSVEQLSTNIFVETVPEPGSLALFAAGLLGLGFAHERRRRSASA